MSVVRVLGRMAELAENAGKHRTEEWVRACSVAYQTGDPLPPAPRYKGPLQDLDALTDETLVELQRAIIAEQAKRGYTPCGGVNPAPSSTSKYVTEEPPNIAWPDGKGRSRKCEHCCFTQHALNGVPIGLANHRCRRNGVDYYVMWLA